MAKGAKPGRLRPKDARMALQMKLSFVHALAATGFGLVYFPKFMRETEDNQYNCTEGWEPVYAATSVFISFLLLDLAMGTVKKTLAVEWVVHHVLFAVVAAVQLAYKRSCFPFTWLILGEMSTIFLDIRWYMIATNNTGHTGFAVVNWAFAGTFFITRILVYGYGLYLFLTRDPNVFSDWTVWQVTPLALSMGYCLNLYWFRSIAHSALGLRKKCLKPKTTTVGPWPNAKGRENQALGGG